MQRHRLTQQACHRYQLKCLTSVLTHIWRESFLNTETSYSTLARVLGKEGVKKQNNRKTYRQTILDLLEIVAPLTKLTGHPWNPRFCPEVQEFCKTLKRVPIIFLRPEDILIFPCQLCRYHYGTFHSEKGEGKQVRSRMTTVHGSSSAHQISVNVRSFFWFFYMSTSKFGPWVP